MILFHDDNQSDPGPERHRLNFTHAVDESFNFLIDRGFQMVERAPTIVRFKKRELEITLYHGRRSWEIGIEITFKDVTYSLSSILRMGGMEKANNYRNWTVFTEPGVARAVGRVADLFRRYGEPVINVDPVYFKELFKRRRETAMAYALGVRADQNRPKAQAAFREGRYGESAELYAEFEGALTPVEQKKLELARRRSKPK